MPKKWMSWDVSKPMFFLIHGTFFLNLSYNIDPEKTKNTTNSMLSWSPPWTLCSTTIFSLSKTIFHHDFRHMSSPQVLPWNTYPKKFSIPYHSLSLLYFFASLYDLKLPCSFICEACPLVHSGNLEPCKAHGRQPGFKQWMDALL